MSKENDVPEAGQGGVDILDRYVPNTDEIEVVAMAVEEDSVPDFTVEDGFEAADSFQVDGNRNSETGVITVSCGAYPPSSFGDVSGKSIAQLRADLTDVLNIAPNAKVIVSGEDVGEDYVLQPGDRVEFIKASGQKG